LWIRSYHSADRLHGRFWERHSFLVASKEGRLIAVAFQSHGAPGWWKWETRSYPVNDELSFPFGSVRQYESALGFGWIVQPAYMVMRSTRTLQDGTQISLFGAAIASLNGSGLIVPYWFLVLMTAALAFTLKLKWPLRFSIRGLFVAVTMVAIVLGLVSVLDR
jgi:hypothetical protein